MAAPKVEDLLKQALQKRSERKAEEAVESLGGMARRKGKNREAALDALRQVALTCPHTWARKDAFTQIGKAIQPHDQEYIDLLHEHLHNEETAWQCSTGLLRLKGQGVYPDLIKIIADKNYSMDTRSSLLKELSDHTKRPFNKATIAVNCDELTEDHFPIAELNEWMAAGFPDPEPIVLPTKELAKLKITLPEDYAKFLREHRGEEYEDEEDQWRLSTADELLETQSIDGHKVPAVRRLKAYAATLREVMDGDQTVDHKGKPYPLSRLEDGVAIGTNTSGDVLYLDPADQNAVWVFHHDGGDVERLSKTFKAWLRQAERI